MRGRNQDEQASGTTPRRVKTKPILASAAAIRISMGRVMVIPTPTACPLIAPMTGFRQLKIARATLAASVSVLTNWNLFAFPLGCIEGGGAVRKVSPGAESLARSCDYDCSDSIVSISLGKDLYQLQSHGRCKGVHLLGAIKRYSGNPIGQLRIEYRVKFNLFTSAFFGGPSDWCLFCSIRLTAFKRLQINDQCNITGRTMRVLEP